MEFTRFPHPMSQKNQKESPSLESAMQRISEIVSAMEEGNLPLEKLIDSYEEGIALVKDCQEKLDAAEKRIQVITRNARGAVALSEFEEQED
jgi:exodeoxyribonuclease VII small subunit